MSSVIYVVPWLLSSLIGMVSTGLLPLYDTLKLPSVNCEQFGVAVG
ncbi:MAG: hypothetical protein ABSA23_04430 [Anaerolineales bacterium]